MGEELPIMILEEKRLVRKIYWWGGRLFSRERCYCWFSRRRNTPEALNTKTLRAPKVRASLV